MSARCVGLPLLITAALAAPAAAQTEPPFYVTTPLYFTCTAPTPVQNSFGAMGLSPTRPAASFRSGAGCGFFDQELLVDADDTGGNNLVDAVFEGDFSGPAKSLSVELHDLLTQPESNLFGSVAFTVILEIDDEEVLDSRDQGDPLEAEATPSSSGLSQSIRFGIDLARLKLTGDETRHYRLTIGKGYQDTVAAWVGGADEVPAGLTFNPTTKLPAPVVSAG